MMNNIATFDVAESSTGSTSRGIQAFIPAETASYSDILPELLESGNRFNTISRFLKKLGHKVTRIPRFQPSLPNEGEFDKREGGVDVFVPLAGTISVNEDGSEPDGSEPPGPFTMIPSQPPSVRSYPLTFFHFLMQVNIGMEFISLITDPVLALYGLLPEVGLEQIYAMLDRISRECGIAKNEIQAHAWNIEQIFLRGFRIVNLPFIIPYPIPLVLRTGEFIWVMSKIMIDTWLIRAAHPYQWERFGVRNRNHDRHCVYHALIVLHPFLSRPANPSDRSAGPLEWSSLYFNREVPMSGIPLEDCDCVCAIKAPPEALKHVLINSEVALQRRSPADESQRFELRIVTGTTGEFGEPGSYDGVPPSSLSMPEASNSNLFTLPGNEPTFHQANMDSSVSMPEASNSNLFTLPGYEPTSHQANMDDLAKAVRLILNVGDRMAHRLQATPAPANTTTNTVDPLVLNSSMALAHPQPQTSYQVFSLQEAPASSPTLLIPNLPHSPSKLSSRAGASRSPGRMRPDHHLGVKSRRTPQPSQSSLCTEFGSAVHQADRQPVTSYLTGGVATASGSGAGLLSSTQGLHGISWSNLLFSELDNTSQQGEQYDPTPVPLQEHHPTRSTAEFEEDASAASARLEIRLGKQPEGQE